MSTGQVFGCGQCLPCRINKRREWTHRIILEAGLYEENAFVTLTYEDKHLPPDNSVSPADLRNFLKRLRKAIEPSKIRFFACAEYGDQTERPHYHLALFGYPSCRNGMSVYSKSRINCCTACDQVRDTWGLGKVFIGSLEMHSAQYIAGYVTKKMTSKNDERLKGRHPEFARMSNRPGIGADAMWDVASVLMHYNLDTSEADVPSALRHGKKILPLGRYLQRRLRQNVGKDEKTPQSVIDKIAEEMYPLRVLAKNSSENPSLKDQIVLANKGAIANIEARHRIFKKRGNI